MTVGHLLLAATMTAYIVFAIGLEEKDLVHHPGDRYSRYQRQVPMLVPRPGRAFVEPITAVEPIDTTVAATPLNKT